MNHLYLKYIIYYNIMSKENNNSNELATNDLVTNEPIINEDSGEDDEVSEYNSESDDDLDDDLIEEGDDDFKVIDFTNTYENMVNKKDKNTLPIMSKFEKARIIGVRAQQIADGAIPTVKVPDKMRSTIEIAKLELKERRIPLIIRRMLTKNKYEDWRIDEFDMTA